MRPLSNSINSRGLVFGVVIICLFGQAAFGQPWDGGGVEGGPYLIYTAADMQAIGGSAYLGAHFKLLANINLSAYTGTSFNIIGSFTGVFDGNGHTISNFTYTSTATDKIGLFAYVDDPDAEIKNLGLINPDVDAGTGDKIGSLVGWMRGGTITNCYAEGGSVSGVSFVGGLVGENNGTVSNCQAAGSVSGEQLVGGLVGRNYGAVSNSCATGIVSAVGAYINHVGGLAGVTYGTITDCYSTASVLASGSNMGRTGGLVGTSHSYISNSYATGSVSGVGTVGGLVGYSTSSLSRLNLWV